jgi:hypothetical protein
MCLHDLIAALHERGVDVTETQIRWAIKSRKVTRPPLDGSLRFDFGEDHLHEITQYFAGLIAKGTKPIRPRREA